MRTSFALVSVLVLAAPVAQAADLPLKAPPPAPPPAYNWTGCYVDGGVGYGMYNDDHYTETYPGKLQFSDTTTDGGRGWLGRFGAGCDYQADRFVIGAFGDYDFASISGKNNVTNPQWDGVPGIWSPSPIGLFGAEGNEKETGAWAIGARLGYLVTPSLLGYVDAGYTQARFGSVQFVTNTSPTIATTSWLNSSTHSGWFIGGGEEYQLAWVPGLFLRAEYRYSQYSGSDLACQTTTGLCVNTTDTSWAEHTKKEVQTATTSLVWRFNWAGH